MLRNKELRRFAAVCMLIAAAAIAAGFAIGTAAGILALAASAAFVAAFFAFTVARYRRIARLSDRADRVLHGEDRLDIAALDEGELSILESEIAKMTLRLREQNDALQREKERLSASLADVAHQLRTPLTSANLILSLLEKDPPAEERRALLQESEALFLQMEWLVNALLKLSRLDAGIVKFQSERVDAGDLVRAAARPLLIPLELHDIALTIDVPQGVALTCDPGWLSEAIRNLLKNCMEGAGDHGRIEVSCADNPLYTEISIRDNGAGFDHEDLPRLFDRYYRGRNASGAGYGIGLALCRSIVAGQGGSVTAKNHPQGGALFAVRFPK